MRILYVTPAYKPAYRMGGPIVTVAAAAEALTRRGHQVTVATTNANLDVDIEVALNHPVDVDGVTVWYFRREEPLRKWLPFIPYLSRSMGFVYAPEMKDGLRHLMAGADVIHTQMPFVYPTYVASRMALRLGKPLFYHQRGNYLASHVRRRALKKRIYIDLFEKPVLRRATGLIALSEAERDAFRALAPATPCHIIPNGVVVPPPDEGASARVEARWGVPSDALVLLFFSRLEAWKGADELLETFARVQSRHPNLFLVMAGDDHCQAASRWLPVAERGGFAQRLIFTGGLVGMEKEDILHRADLFSLPSSGEGLSMAMLEAMAHRTAVMLSPQCNFPDAERVGAGIIVEKDVGAMASALESLIADRDRLQAMGEAGRALMIREYSWDVVTDRLLEVYERAITK